MTKKTLSILIILLLIIIVGGIIIFLKNESTNEIYDNNNNQSTITGENNMNNQSKETKINIIIDNQKFSATLYDNETTNELIKMFPMTITMDDLNNNEKYYYLSNNLPTSPNVLSKINIGDFMLYGSDCLVLFYESFNTSYSYTKLGYIDNISNLKSSFKSSNVTITFELLD